MTYSFEQIIASSAASFVFSGVLTSLFKDWLDRARPDITITSFGLGGDEEPIELPQRLVELSGQCGWAKQLHRFEKYKKLRDESLRLRRIRARLKIVQEITEKWTADRRSWQSVESGQCTFEELSGMPIFNDEAVGSLLYGAIRRAELLPVPISLEEVTKLTAVTEIKEETRGWHIYMRNKGLLVPTKNSPSESSTLGLTLVAKSLAAGCKRNLYHYLHEVRRISIEDTGKISDLLEALDSVLLPRSLPAVKLTIYNPGAKPVAFHSFAQMRFHNKELRDLTVLLKFSAPNSLKESDGLTKALIRAASPEEITVNTGADGDEVSVADPLPVVGDVSRLFVGAKSQSEAHLVAVEPLAGSADRVLALYRAAVLEYSVELVSIRGKKLCSRPTTFGLALTDEEKKMLRSSSNPYAET